MLKSSGQNMFKFTQKFCPFSFPILKNIISKEHEGELFACPCWKQKINRKLTAFVYEKLTQIKHN